LTKTPHYAQLSLLNFHKAQKDWRSSQAERTVTVMVGNIIAFPEVGGLHHRYER
jgi:hypothetical protein